MRKVIILCAVLSTFMVLFTGCPPSGQKVIVPNLVGLWRDEASVAIEAAGLTAGAIGQAHDAALDKGYVLTQNPAAGAEAAKGAVVAFKVSLGPAPGNAPQFINGAAAELDSAVLGPEGGDLEGLVQSTGTYVYVEVPDSALEEDVEIAVGFDSGTSTTVDGIGGEIGITLAAAGVDSFEEPVKITFSYSPAKAADAVPVPYYVDLDGNWHLVTLCGLDPENSQATFLTWHPTEQPDAPGGPQACFTWVYAPDFTSRKSDEIVDSMFRSSHDGFQVDNGGSAINPGGECLGMVTFAQWYESASAWTDGGLFWRFMTLLEPTNDLVGQNILATRAHNAVHRSWKYYLANLVGPFLSLSRVENAISIRNALANTGNGVILCLAGPGNPISHAVLAYRFYNVEENVFIDIYDPNRPDDLEVAIQDRPTYSLQLVPVEGVGYVWADYRGYNIVVPVGTYGDLAPQIREDFSNILQDANENFHSSRDAIITVSSHTEAQVVTETTPTLTGYIQSGQVLVDFLRVRIHYSSTESADATTPVAANGAFSVSVPLRNGSNLCQFITYGRNAKDRRIEVTNNYSRANRKLYLECQPPPNITGKVTDGLSTNWPRDPIAGATIWVTALWSEDVLAQATSGLDGNYALSGLEPGLYWLHGKKDGYGGSLKMHEVQDPPWFTGNIELFEAVEESELVGEWWWDYFNIRPNFNDAPYGFSLDGFGAGYAGPGTIRPLTWHTTDSGEIRMTWFDAESNPLFSFVGYATRHPRGNMYFPVTPDGSLYFVGYHWDYNWSEAEWLDHRGKQTTAKR